MKTIIMLLWAVLTPMVGSAWVVDAPSKVITTFEKMYPKASDTDWEEDEDGNFVAFFHIGETYKEAYFRSAGIWLFTITEISEDELPERINTYLEDEYSETEIMSARKYEDPKTKLIYEVFVQSGTEILEDEQEEEESKDEDSEGEDEFLEADSIRHLKLSFDQEGKFIAEEEVEF
jgi:hypothetical protein